MKFFVCPLIGFNHSSDRHSIEITRRNVEQSMKSRETVELSSVKTKSLMFSETGPQGGDPRRGRRTDDRAFHFCPPSLLVWGLDFH
ncbi:unnamed protein product, partial [Nesidiocoris tenuis]